VERELGGREVTSLSESTSPHVLYIAETRSKNKAKWKGHKERSPVSIGATNFDLEQ